MDTLRSMWSEGRCYSQMSVVLAGRRSQVSGKEHLLPPALLREQILNFYKKFIPSTLSIPPTAELFVVDLHISKLDTK